MKLKGIYGSLFSGSFIGFGFGFFLLAWVVWKIRHALDKQYGIPPP
jgi:hypothetical protein